MSKFIPSSQGQSLHFGPVRITQEEGGHRQEGTQLRPQLPARYANRSGSKRTNILLDAHFNKSNCFASQLQKMDIYRDRLKSMQILLSRTQAGPGRAVKQEQEEISRYHVQTF